MTRNDSNFPTQKEPTCSALIKIATLCNRAVFLGDQGDKHVLSRWYISNLMWGVQWSVQCGWTLTSVHPHHRAITVTFVEIFIVNCLLSFQIFQLQNFPYHLNRLIWVYSNKVITPFTPLNEEKKQHSFRWYRYLVYISKLSVPSKVSLTVIGITYTLKDMTNLLERRIQSRMGVS